ncbi:MAG TPA: hypothetical protein VFE58_04555 [Tepidisphaeraceae bacterium]|jgi:hypothetical protein|nr:hypothetical protein [Tepidisphaeraceae bacterium]
MGRRQNWGIVLALAVAGCQPVVKKEPATQEAVQAPTTAPTDANAGSPEALARKAEEWTKMLAALKAKREAAATEPVVATTKPASRPVVVAEEKPRGAALVFSPTTEPVIDVHPPVEASTQPIVVAHTVPGRVVVKDELEEKVKENLKNSPRDPAANLDYQLVRFLRDEQAPDLAALSGLPADDREAISALVDGLTNFRAGLRGDPNGMSSKKVRPLLDMADRLRTQNDLQIPTMALCMAVKGYGLYDPIQTPFREGRENPALLYCEVNGFASRPGDGNMWETKLTEDVVLFKGENQVWKKTKVDEIIDRCKNRRHDFYVMNRIQFPATLPAGAYTLKVTIIDEIGNRVAEAMTPVTIEAIGSGTTEK